MVISYRQPVGLSLTVFAVLRLVTDRETDGLTNGIGPSKGGAMHRPPKMVLLWCDLAKLINQSINQSIINQLFSQSVSQSINYFRPP